MSLDNKYSEKEINNRIEKVTHTKQEQEWLKENKEAIDEYNKRIEKYGYFSDKYRRF
ncbi:MAG: type II toxin-antitoxin system CcdA family antitoxin [Epsilonproteobacteria bacterium]|nr:type II toxin-antitoxin system CcdA family antitoxin [Campylobacterota bacterium]